MGSKRLSRMGQKLRESIAEAGFEVTPNELVEGIEEAAQRIGYGRCSLCRCDNMELRYGMCFGCAMAGDGGNET